MNPFEIAALTEIEEMLGRVIVTLDRLAVPMPDRKDRDGATAWLGVIRCKVGLVREGIYQEQPEAKAAHDS